MPDAYRAAQSDESGLTRLLAPNPSPMTHTGTNTFAVGQDDLAIIDPGPDHPDHLAAIRDHVADRPVKAILVTHSHLDHSPGARRLSDMVQAPVMAFGPSDAGRSDTMLRLKDSVGGGEGVDAGFAPDVTLAEGDSIAGQGWTLRAHHTPGHMANHLSFHWVEGDAVFTGDTVMGWASTMISPPDGDLGQFMTSLTLLEALGAGRFLPAHGDPVTETRKRCQDLRAHRLLREKAILEQLDRPKSISDIVASVYKDTPAALHGAAARNVLAHLVWLAEQGLVRAAPSLHPDAMFSRR